MQKKINIISKSAEFFLAGMKALADEDGGRILLGDNIGGVAVEAAGKDLVCKRLHSIWIPFNIHMYWTTCKHSSDLRKT